ncbi:MAG TPA: hypothetical protein DC049_12790 [Spirochaetia bacterium]|nr:hypothetical protein [Spirochaetia bacterium]
MPNKPQLIIIAGHNGCGKSTFAFEYLKHFKYEYLNPDEMAKSLSPLHIDKARIQAGKLFFEKIQEKITNKESFSIESTLSGKYLIGFLDKIKKKYYIRIVYIFLDNTEMAIERIKIRVAKGGHHIPDEDVIRRYERSKNNFWDIYKNLADDWEIHYNGEGEFIQVAIGIKEKCEIIDDKLFALFTRRMAL